MAALGVACDDGNDGDDGQADGETGNADTNGDGDGDSSGDGDGECEDEGSVHGDNADCAEYVECAQNTCGDAYETCFGGDYLNGNFGGTCADYMSCNLACGCGDTDCTTECYNSHAAMGTPCGDCLINDIGGCIAANCLDALQSCG
ncbi:MAG: hypothetical protein R6X02_30160 [Enhygromyxa sp.]